MYRHEFVDGVIEYEMKVCYSYTMENNLEHGRQGVEHVEKALYVPLAAMGAAVWTKERASSLG